MIATLAELLDARTREGELYEKLDDKRVRCYACAHRCVIFEGKRGICQVRFNRDGKLYVPWGYVSSLGLDPIEKKPFYHVLPGARTLTFGMLGCDLHCPYCFSPETPVTTERGVLSIEEIFCLGEERLMLPDGEASRPQLQVVTEAGELRPVQAAFKHHYEGELITIKPYYLPALRCTPDHRLYATTNPEGGPIEIVRAEELTPHHFLVIPKRFTCSTSVTLDVSALLEELHPSYKIPHKLAPHQVEWLMVATQEGVSSRELGQALGKDPSYIRHVRSKVYRGLWQEERRQRLVIEGGRVRFLKEHRPGVPLYLPVEERLARLLGYYCAEGCVVLEKGRPNSRTLIFALGPQEHRLANEICTLLQELFDVTARRVRRRTTLAVEVTKASVAWLFERLCGAKSREKRVPEVIFKAPPSIIQAFLEAYTHGDGHCYENGKITVTTKSRALAYGVAWLVLQLGNLPSLYINVQPQTKQIEDRHVYQAAEQYTIVWYKDKTVPRRYRETSDYYLVPIRSICREPYQGPVYNLEIDDTTHSYLAGFCLVKNCQNWEISQTLRDTSAGALPHDVTPEELVSLAQRYGARAVISSYNEPLITSEWAVAVFKEAKKLGLLTGYVSNGNATREVLQYLRPHLDCYKIDLKSFQDKNYRVLGAVLSKVLDGIAMVHELGFWLEIVTLVVPGFNDSDDELRQIAKFLVSISPDIPWHVTAFHKDYKMTDPDNTPAETLIRAAQIGYDAGLHFVYTGNLPGMTGRYENTYCPGCGALLIERYGFAILQNRLRDGHCPNCGRTIPGVWI